MALTRDEFEQLLSDWLDNPHDRDLCERLDAALAADPGLRSLSDQHQTIMSILATPELPVDWDALRAAIRSAIAAEAARSHGASDDDALDAALARYRRIDDRVLWPRLQERISTRVAAERRPSLARRRWWLTVGASVTSAAAVLTLAVLQPWSATSGPIGGDAVANQSQATDRGATAEPQHASLAGVAVARVSSPARDRAAGNAVVRISVVADPVSEKTAPDASEVTRSVDSNLFVMVEPLRPQSPSFGGLY